MGVTLTEKAASEVKKIIDKMVEEQGVPEGGELVLRVGVQGGGCSGFSYSLGFDSSTSERDRIIDVHGVKLAVDKKFDPYLDGTEIDYYDGLEKRGFVFNNPNVVKSCVLRAARFQAVWIAPSPRGGGLRATMARQDTARGTASVGRRPLAVRSATASMRADADDSAPGHRAVGTTGGIGRRRIIGRHRRGVGRQEGRAMARVGEPVAAPLARDRVLWIPADEEPGLAQAMRAESLLGHVDHRVALGIAQETTPGLVAGADEQTPLVEHTPVRVAGLRAAVVHLGHRAIAAVHRDVPRSGSLRKSRLRSALAKR